MAHDALIETERYRARLAANADDLGRSLALRARVFRGDPGVDDRDGFDARCRHVLVEDKVHGGLAASYRILDFPRGNDIGTSYAAQFYGLDALAGFEGPMIEVGRFCIAPEAQDADVLRVAWAALTRIVDSEGVALLFGCSSFPGTDPDRYRDTLALLGARHLAPGRWRPGEKAETIYRFATDPAVALDPRTAIKAMPPLLRTYLSMGGWVSDHAVIDRDLGTLHVFTGLEVSRVPPARARALRELAGV